MWSRCDGQLWLRYLGTDSSPLVLFSGLQRSVTTVLRPAGHEDVASRDLNSTLTAVRTQPWPIYTANLKGAPVEEVDIWNFLGGLRVLFRYGLYSIKTIFHSSS